ncbi:MAG: cytochrome c3 family protein [Hyphomicrobiaceae bacterium]
MVGRHIKVKCASCHKTKAFKDAPRACQACHEDQVHQGRIGNTCASCHSPTGWALWRFNHDRQTRFALTGAHKGVRCHTCHQTRHATKVALPMNCYSCHAKDDAHRGAFGQACEKCHATTSFKQRVRRR